MKTINLYNEDGIAIYLTNEFDICSAADEDASIKVIGHEVYICSAEEAQQKIRTAYLEKMGIEDPLLAL